MNAMFPETSGYRVGAVVLGKDASKNFMDDKPDFDALYGAGYRAFQLFLIGYQPDYLKDFRKWADDQSAGNIEISGLLAFIEPGDGGACPISANKEKRLRSIDQVKTSIDLSPLVRSTGLHGPLFMGLMNSGLDALTLGEQHAHMIEFLATLDHTAKTSNHLIGCEVLNQHEFPPPGPTTLAKASALFKEAGATSNWLQLLLDTCHQGQEEPSTTAAWQKYGPRGSCIHFSDFGRGILGWQQAFSPSLWPFLVGSKLPLTIYVESVGSDASPFIKKALHVNNVSPMTCLQVLIENMAFVKRGFAQGA